MLKYVETKEAPAAIGPYSQGVVVNGFAFFSGQVPLSPQTGEVVGTTIEEQAEQVMKNIKGLLDSQNAAFTDVVADTLKNGDKIQLVGFGTFEVAERAERTGRNPQTGADMVIPASKSPKFKAGKALKDIVNA